MKSILFLTLMLSSSICSAKEVVDFNKELIRGVQKDISSDNDTDFKQKRPVSRGPASVEGATEEGTQIQDTQKLEKTNFRQIGPNKW